MKKIITLTLFLTLIFAGGSAFAFNLEIDLGTDSSPIYQELAQNWINNDIRINVLFNNGSFNGYRYKITNSEQFPTEGFSNWINQVKDTVVINTEGVNYLHIEARTASGHIVRRTTGRFNLDKTNPNVTFSYPQGHRRDFVLVVEAQDSLSGVRYIRTPDNNVIYASTVYYSIFSNGIYAFEVVDYAGNSRTETIIITNIDRAVPNSPVLILDEDDLNFIIRAIHQGDIGGSGIKRILYKKETKTGELIQDWSTYVNPLIISRNSPIVVKTKAEDNAGNFSAESSISLTEEYLFNPFFVIRQNTYDITQEPITLSLLHTNIDFDRIILPNGITVSFLPLDYVASENGRYVFTIYDKDNNPHEIVHFVNNIRANPIRLNTRYVTLDLFSEDSLSGVEFMRLKNEDGVWNPFIPYQKELNWALSEGSGLKVVWVQYKDRAGNISTPIADFAIVDKNAPRVTLFELNNGNRYTNNINIPVRVRGFDPLSEISLINLSNDNSIWQNVPYTEEVINWNLGNLTNGVKSVFMYLQDDLGNSSATYQGQVFLDTVKPTVTFNINNGVQYTTSREVRLNIFYNDLNYPFSGSGVEKLIIREGSSEFIVNTINGNGQMTIPWILQPGDRRTITIQAVDKAGNVSDEYSQDIIIDNLEIEEFVLTDVVHPRNPNFRAMSWPFAPQNMLSGANISFEVRLKSPYERDKVVDEVFYELLITNHEDYTILLEGRMDAFINDIYRTTLTLPDGIPKDAKVYIKITAQRDLLVSPFDRQIVYFPGPDSSSKALIGIIEGNIREFIRFNEIR